LLKKLNDLFARLPVTSVKGSLDRAISSLAIDSRRVAPGALFFALPGLRADGGQFIDEAVSRGAVAVVSSKPRQLISPKIAFIQVADARAALADVARRYFDGPDAALELVGVTGTNGKTTVTHLLRHLLAEPDARCGMIGTVSYDLGVRSVPSYKTTPESLDLFAMLAQMSEAGCRAAAMEVSSHGIDQQRVRGMQFAAAAFLNLTRDHLDYHGSLEAYFEVKSRLFTGAIGHLPKVAAINLDDAYGRKLVESIPVEVKLVTFGEHPSAAVRAAEVELGFSGTRFQLLTPEGAFAVESHLLGRYNVSNLLAAFAVCHGLGRPLGPLIGKLATFGGIPGRMERIDAGQEFNVLVDYAHTDDALRNALGMLRPITPGRLLVVFGCGGNRDRTKRPLMTAAVQESADVAWATSDNPRSESLERIFEDMKAGVSDPQRISFVEDRRRAISLALDAARPGDSLVIAGKGHETFQEFSDTVVPFDDRQVARELIAIKQIKPS
jgi:UDP-N-acetylmuramoyl-L-alanyl-D-glutamate--2,6-diaminopimelate ligase